MTRAAEAWLISPIRKTIRFSSKSSSIVISRVRWYETLADAMVFSGLRWRVLSPAKPPRLEPSGRAFGLCPVETARGHPSAVPCLYNRHKRALTWGKVCARTHAAAQPQCSSDICLHSPFWGSTLLFCHPFDGRRLPLRQSARPVSRGSLPANSHLRPFPPFALSLPWPALRILSYLDTSTTMTRQT